MMVWMALLVSTGLGIGVGYGIGRVKVWLSKHEVKSKTIDLDSPLLKTRLRVKGIIKNV